MENKFYVGQIVRCVLHSSANYTVKGDLYRILDVHRGSHYGGTVDVEPLNGRWSDFAIAQHYNQRSGHFQNNRFESLSGADTSSSG